ncbi:NHLP bacteriocin system secretion protein [Scytonema hofmannii PCC 7110]|uniref:NHLP bacteriocin system secretion protein n=1 Tax=Scytonema hofmannii PCC 7110 TaxID=128403 RepID=A0A139XEH3_9CYAN|nr:NHLP bacteriocin system secretion protein [Scytonema hofmannii]KYC43090.1 NHLP bacteriocin system secretion protein [Scytonema hofmannii PCC 7110]
MLEQKRRLFRQESVERLSSPERLDQLMQVVSPRSWLPLASLSSLVVVAVIWSVYGKIPITIDGQGVLIYPRQVVPLQSTSAGQILALNVKAGDRVKKGDILATLEQADLRKQLQLSRSKLTQLEKQNSDVNLLQDQRQSLDKKTIQEQRQFLLRTLQDLRNFTPILREKGLMTIKSDRQNLQNRLKTLNELLPTLKKRWEVRQRLFQQGAVSDDTVLEARQQYLDSLANLDQAKSQLDKLGVQETETLEKYFQNLNEIKNYQAQIKELDSKLASSAEQDQSSTINRQKEIQEAKREIAQIEERLSTNSKIVSQYSGQVLEVTIAPGQVIDTGTRLGSVKAETSSSKLVSIALFPVGDGKKIQPGMKLQITPSTVKRERFGGITGDVTNISPFPITREAAASVVGNSEIVEGLVSQKQEGLIQVFADIEQDSTTFSGYKWSSSTGPQMKISSGTTTIVRVQVEERAPITFVLPILRSFSGIY